MPALQKEIYFGVVGAGPPPVPSQILVNEVVSAADNVHGAVGAPLGTPLMNVIAQWVPPEVGQVRFKYANRVLAYPGALISQPATPITGAKFAVGPLHTNGQSWTGTPTVQTGITLPSGGAFYTSGWINTGGMRNANGEIGLAWSVPTGQTFYGEQPSYYGYGAVNEDVSGLSGLVGPLNVNPLFVVCEYYVNSTTKRLIIIGDSLTRGLSSTSGDTNPDYKHTLGWRLGPDRGVAVCRAAGSGQTLDAWADIAGRPWLWDFEQFTGATVLILLGTNDVNGGVATSSTMLTSLQTIVTRCFSLGASRVWGTTVAPSSTYSGAQNTTRSTYNTAVKAKPYGISYVLDVDAVLRDPGAPNSLLAANACADNIHFTTAANLALENQLIADGMV
jgi:hypothetical protein